VTADRSWFVAVFRIVIVTPGTTAFCVSVTVPCNVAVDCAASGAAQTNRVNTRSPTGRNRPIRITSILSFADQTPCNGPMPRRKILERRAAAGIEQEKVMMTMHRRECQRRIDAGTRPPAFRAPFSPANPKF
jgi:hypothetical protein